MIAYHGKEEIKNTYLKRVESHRLADEIVKGQYWEKGKGCAVGCTIHSGDHGAYETELGIPRVLARLEDGIFEALPDDLAKTWPERFLSAIKPGADLSKVWNKFAAWLLIDETDGVIKFVKTKQTKDAINNVGKLYLRSLREDVSLNDWREAAAAAAYAAAAAAADADAAYAAAAAAAAAADADAAAAAAAAAAADAAYADADAAAAARRKARIRQSEKLLELLSESK